MSNFDAYNYNIDDSQDSRQPFFSSRRRSFMERLRKNMNMEIYDDEHYSAPPTEEKSSDQEKILLQNVKEMFRSGYSLGEVTRMANQLLGTNDISESQILKVSNSVSMDVDSSVTHSNSNILHSDIQSCFQPRQGLRQRKSFHQNRIIFKDEGHAFRRTNSFEYPKGNQGITITDHHLWKEEYERKAAQQSMFQNHNPQEFGFNPLALNNYNFPSEQTILKRNLSFATPNSSTSSDFSSPPQFGPDVKRSRT